MKNTTALDANALLDLPTYRSRELFGGTTQEMKALYRRLVHRWHPDHNKDPKAHDVFIHLQGLYQAANSSHVGIEVKFQDVAGRQFRFQAQSRQDFELGMMYRGNGSIAYMVEPNHEASFQNYRSRVLGLAYSSEKMREQICPQLPSLHSSHWGEKGGLIVIKRDPEGILLRDMLAYLKLRNQQIDPRHVGWILNALHNLACYLTHSKIAHQAIGIDTVWINPRRHSVQLLGGWFHCLSFGDDIRALPAYAVALAPRSYLREKKAGARLDQECIRGIGRILLGDISGNRLNPATPSPMVSALRLPAPGTAVEEYQRWKQALQASFGPPKFVAMELSHNNIYQGE